MKILSVWAELRHTCRWTDGQTGRMKLTGALRNFTNVPKKGSCQEIRRTLFALFSFQKVKVYHTPVTITDTSVFLRHLHVTWYTA